MNRWILLIIAVESLTQLICRAELFDRPRCWLSSKGWFFKELLTCPYCVSVWATIFILSLFPFWSVSKWFILLLVLHRLSNALHDLFGIILGKKINQISERRPPHG